MLSLLVESDMLTPKPMRLAPSLFESVESSHFTPKLILLYRMWLLGVFPESWFLRIIPKFGVNMSCRNMYTTVALNIACVR